MRPRPRTPIRRSTRATVPPSVPRRPCRAGTPSPAPGCRARRAPRTRRRRAPARTTRLRDTCLPFARWHGRLNAMAGDIVHYEIAAKDADRAQAFWGGLFGWSFQGSGMPDIDYRMAQITESAGAALYAGPEKVGHPIVYHAVDDIDASIAKVNELGGSAEDKMPVPG